jgi:hypothetical protein
MTLDSKPLWSIHIYVNWANLPGKLLRKYLLTSGDQHRLENTTSHLRRFIVVLGLLHKVGSRTCEYSLKIDILFSRYTAFIRNFWRVKLIKYSMSHWVLPRLQKKVWAPESKLTKIWLMSDLILSIILLTICRSVYHTRSNLELQGNFIHHMKLYLSKLMSLWYYSIIVTNVPSTCTVYLGIHIVRHLEQEWSHDWQFFA